MLWIPVGFLCGLGWFQEALPDPFDPDRQSWSLALTGIAVPSMPRAAGMGGTDWFGAPLCGWSGEFLARGDEHSVQIQVRYEGDFERSDLRFRLDASGASVQVAHSSDSSFGPLEDVGGVACLLTDGRDTVLEFEIYAVLGGSVHPLAGAVSLRGSAKELALDFARRATDPERSPFDRLVRITGLDERQSHGYVDELGRRQGPWSLQRKDGSRMQVGWRDGVPHGLELTWDEAGRLRSLQHYEFGLQEGESMDWNEEGQCVGLGAFVRGQAYGRRVAFHSSGMKQLDEIERAPDRSRSLARFDGLHTRPQP